jgi:hypothetical protein
MPERPALRRRVGRRADRQRDRRLGAETALVQHFGETGGALVDSTANDNDGVNRGARFQPLGQAASSWMFDGESNEVEVRTMRRCRSPARRGSRSGVVHPP